jgi:hypothetical protein
MVIKTSTQYPTLANDSNAAALMLYTKLPPSNKSRLPDRKIRGPMNQGPLKLPEKKTIITLCDCLSSSPKQGESP